MRELTKKGVGIIYISHKMDEIKEIGDVITVLKDGTYVGTRNVKEITLDDVIRMMVGREIKGTYHNESVQDFSGEPVIFRGRNMNRKDGRVRNVSFQVRKGDRGVCGPCGSGPKRADERNFRSRAKAFRPGVYRRGGSDHPLPL